MTRLNEKNIPKIGVTEDIRKRNTHFLLFRQLAPKLFKVELKLALRI